LKINQNYRESKSCLGELKVLCDDHNIIEPSVTRKLGREEDHFS